MTFANRTQLAAPAPAGSRPAWRTRDIVLTAMLGVTFGVVFFVWNTVYAGLEFVQPPVLKDVVYGMWLVPAVLAPVLIRRGH